MSAKFKDFQIDVHNIKKWMKTFIKIKIVYLLFPHLMGEIFPNGINLF